MDHSQDKSEIEALLRQSLEAVAFLRAENARLVELLRSCPLFYLPNSFVDVLLRSCPLFYSISRHRERAKGRQNTVCSRAHVLWPVRITPLLLQDEEN